MLCTCFDRYVCMWVCVCTPTTNTNWENSKRVNSVFSEFSRNVWICRVLFKRCVYAQYQNIDCSCSCNTNWECNQFQCYSVTIKPSHPEHFCVLQNRFSRKPVQFTPLNTLWSLNNIQNILQHQNQAKGVFSSAAQANTGKYSKHRPPHIHAPYRKSQQNAQRVCNTDTRREKAHTHIYTFTKYHLGIYN